MKNVNCPLCGLQNVSSQFSNNDFRSSVFHCPACGIFTLTDLARTFYVEKYERNKYILSAISRRAWEYGGEPPSFTTRNIESCLDERRLPDTLVDRIHLILEYLMKKSQRAGDSVKIHIEKDYPIAYAKDPAEFRFMLDSLDESNFITMMRSEPKVSLDDTVKDIFDCKLTIEGWSKVEQLYKKTPKGNQCFVAMWFSSELDNTYSSSIEPAILETGYKPLRIDKKEHNDKIDDQIIAEIRRSSLLIADFTGQRGGVYFEAGFAMGLGIPVIWTCHKGHIDDCHFDTNHYNHIVWTSPEELKEKLKNRILATVPLDK